MYFYEVIGAVEYNDAVLMHEKQFTPAEFHEMCDEVPKKVTDWDNGTYSEYYHYDNVVEYLVQKYNFKKFRLSHIFLLTILVIRGGELWIKTLK